MKKLVIFGKNGFIAKELILKLKKKKIFFKAFSKKELNLEQKSSIKKIKNFVKKDSIVIFISAIAPCKNLIDLEKNKKMALNLIQGLLGKKIKQLIYISSDAVYSDTKKKITEFSKCKPSSIHGKMHLFREKILFKFFEKKLTILRPTLIYGKGDTHNSYGPNKFLRLIKEKKNIKLFGKGEELRDHISIDDVVNFIILSLGKNLNEKINLVTGKTISFFNIAKLCIKRGKNCKIIFVKRNGPMPHNGLRKFDNKKIKNIFKNYTYQNIKTYIRNY